MQELANVEEMHVVVEEPNAKEEIVQEEKNVAVEDNKHEEVAEEEGTKSRTKRSSKFRNINAPNTNKE